jgi:hypothetical protein
VICLVFAPSIWSRSKTIKIGLNAPMTGDIPKVGEGSKFAAQMWLEDINKAGGLTVGKKKYKVELIIEDNESKAESAVKAATKLIVEDEVLVNKSGYYQRSSFCFPWLLPRSLSGAGFGQFHHPGVPFFQSRGFV